MGKTVDELRAELDSLTGRRKMANQEPAEGQADKRTPEEVQAMWDDMLSDYRPTGK